MDNAAEVMDYLVDLDSQGQQQNRTMPDIHAVGANWQALAFVINDTQVLCAMDEVSEMFPVPTEITMVPGAANWVLGLANVRGNLLTLVDLDAFLNGKPASFGKESRVLVVQNKDTITGVVVPDVAGMRYMDEEQRVSDVRLDGCMGDYVYDLFETDTTSSWPVFSMAALMADQRFLIAAE